MHFPKSIEELIEEDQKLLNAEQNDDDNEDWQDEDEDEKGSEVEEVKAEGNGEKPEDAEGDQDNRSIGPFGSESNEEPRDYFDDEDLDPIILGLRIYTPGGAVVSVTGQVIGEYDDGEHDDDEDKGDESVKSKSKKGKDTSKKEN